MMSLCGFDVAWIAAPHATPWGRAGGAGETLSYTKSVMSHIGFHFHDLYPGAVSCAFAGARGTLRGPDRDAVYQH